MKVCVTFTYGITLLDWKRTGNLAREVALYRRLADNGIEVTLLTYGDGGDRALEAEIAPVRVLPAYEGRIRPTTKLASFLGSLWMPIRLRKKLMTFDLFKTNQIWGGWVAALAALLTGRPWILRCGYEHFRFARMQKKRWWKLLGIWVISFLLYQCAGRVVVTAEFMRDWIRKTFLVGGARISVIPNFIDSDLFTPGGIPWALRKNRVIFVGRLAMQKNLPALVRATAQVGVGLDLVGNGDMETELRQLAAALGADVEFFGAVPNELLPELLGQYRYFALPSFFEGHPKTLLEAMACGLACLGCRVEGVEEVLKHGVTGYLSGTSCGDLAVGLKELMNNPNQAREIGAAAAVQVRETCGMDVVARQELALLGRG
ncbi:MAG: glycosyltransferase family 4 protein [Bdellovibrionales bacterium]|nr:glycosyltransferase family 4 protein [Bdellovibrionales bacterium]